jgi:hypothetical protein
VDLVFLYNERNRPEVGEVWRDLRAAHSGVNAWFAPENIDMFGDIFTQIFEAIERSDGVVLFVAADGLGPFQQHIELVAVRVEQWHRGAAFGFVVVQLSPNPPLPRPLSAYPTIFHAQGQTPSEIAGKIAQMARSGDGGRAP